MKVPGRPVLVIAVLHFCTVGPAAHLQRGAPPPRIAQPVAREMAAEYRRLVDQYVSGDPDLAIGVVRTWQVRSVEAVQDVQKWEPAAMRAAAMLETDAAVARAREISETSGPFVADWEVTSVLGQRLRLADRWLQLADKIKTRETSTFRRRWNLTVGRLLLWHTFVAHAYYRLADASATFPNDPAVLLALGTVKESMALVSNMDEVMLPPPEGSTEVLQYVRYLDSARATLERAVEADPKSAEARLRLANVRLNQGAEGRAASLLVEARALPSSTIVAYLSTLLLGKVRERQGDLKAAIDLYVDARGRMPGAQSAYLAHAHALRADGQPDRAVEVLQQMLSRPERVTDPWSEYPIGLDEAATDLDALRAEVRR